MRQRRAPPKRSVLRVIELGNQSIEFPFIRFQFKFLRFMRFLKEESRRNGINVGDKRVDS